MIRGRLYLAVGLALLGLLLFAWHWILGDSFAGFASLAGCVLGAEIIRPSAQDVQAAALANMDD